MFHSSTVCEISLFNFKVTKILVQDKKNQLRFRNDNNEVTITLPWHTSLFKTHYVQHMSPQDFSFY